MNSRPLALRIRTLITLNPKYGQANSDYVGRTRGVVHVIKAVTPHKNSTQADVTLENNYAINFLIKQ